MFLSKSFWHPIVKTLNLKVWTLPLICLYDFTLFVIDMYQNGSISLFPTPFDHFHFQGSRRSRRFQNFPDSFKIIGMISILSGRFQYCPDGLYSVWMILTLSGQCQNGLDDFNTARTVLIMSGLKITFSLFGCMTLVGSWVTSWSLLLDCPPFPSCHRCIPQIGPIKDRFGSLDAVSYTHLTLPTNREV